VYDWRRGTDTLGWIPLDEIDVPSATRDHGRAYQPTPALAFNRLLRKVPLPRNVGFVDFGCGKGRVLLLAAEAGFERVVGIEFAPELAAEARRNVDRWRTTQTPQCQLSVIEGDVVEYQVSRGDGVFFFFNPFDDVILDAVLDRIDDSLRTAPREAWIVYHNPLEGSRIEARGTWHHVAQYSFLGNDFAVYRRDS
jgi:SAM-dependent methyltransferase